MSVILTFVVKRWSVGQAAKTPPSHGGNKGSIPLFVRTPVLMYRSFFIPLKRFFIILIIFVYFSQKMLDIFVKNL